MLAEDVEQRTRKNTRVVARLPGLLPTLAGGEQDVAAVRHLEVPASLSQLRVVTVEVGLERPRLVDLVRLAGSRLQEVVHRPGPRARMATIQDHGNLWPVHAQLGKQNRELLV